MPTIKTSTDQQQFKTNPAWAVIQTTIGLQISAGDDMVYTLDCVANIAEFFCNTPKSFTRADIPDDGLVIFEQLLSAQVIIPEVRSSKNSAAKVAILSDSKSVTKQVSDSLAEKGHKIVTNQADITIVLRTTKSLTEFLKSTDYKSLASVHIFIDLAYHHTVSIGPLVFPGDTPCIACLEGRLLARWGSQTPPAQPNASKQLLGLAVELTELEIARYRQGDTSLAFKTVAHDTDQRNVETYKLLTVPQCPYCKNANAYANGALVI